MKIIGLCAAVVLGGISVAAVWLIVYGYGLLAEDDLRLIDKAAGVQALAAAIALFATILLVGVTAWYAWITGRLLHQSGPVIGIELLVAWRSPSVEYGGMVLGQLSSLRSGPPDDRFSVPFLAVQIRNSGNIAASVARVSIESKAGFSYTELVPPTGPSCPFELEAHTCQTAFISVGGVNASIYAWNKVMKQSSLKLRAVAELGSGVVGRSEWEQLPSTA